MARDAMRVLHRDPKTGEIKVRVENADDLWHLHNLVLPGDLVRASTYRREEVKTDKVRPERGEKVRVTRSEEHTSELQSQSNLVCRLLLEKKKNTNPKTHVQSDTT